MTNEETHAEELTKGRTGKDLATTTEKESPLDEIRRVNQETKELKAHFEKMNSEMQRAAANMMVAGHSMAGNQKPQKTEAEIIAEEAANRVKKFMGYQ